MTTSIHLHMQILYHKLRNNSIAKKIFYKVLDNYSKIVYYLGSEVVQLEFNNNMPIYLQVADDIKKQLITGKIKTGDKLPSNNELAAMYKVNPNTVQRIYKHLEMEGICYTKRGLGTFVMENENLVENIKNQMVNSIVKDFIEKMHSLDYTDNDIIEIIRKNEKE